MSDINLMPLDNRDEELKEWKKKQAEKAEVRVELSNPSLKKQEEQKNSGDFWSKIKNNWQGMMSKKPEEAVIKINNVKPAPVIEIPKHRVINPEQVRKVFYQNHSPVNLDKNSDLKQRIAENIKQPINNSQHFAPINKSEIKLEIKPEVKTETKQKNIELEINHKINNVPANLNIPNSPTVKSNFDINLIPADSNKTVSDKIIIKKSVIILVLTLLVCSGVYISLMLVAKNKEKTVKDLETATESVIQETKTLRENSQETNIFLDILQEIKRLLEGHVYTERIFAFLEQNTLKTVYYSDLQFNYEAGTINLIANAKDYHALAEQILVFQNLKEVVERVDISAVALEKPEEAKETKEVKERLVTFNLSLKIKPNFLLKK